MNDPATEIMIMIRRVAEILDEDLENYLPTLDPDTAANALYLQKQMHDRVSECERLMGEETR